MSRLPKPVKQGGEYVFLSTFVKCGECNYRVNNEKALQLHVRYSHGRALKPLDRKTDITFFCKACSLYFQTEKELEIHSIKTHR